MLVSLAAALAEMARLTERAADVSRSDLLCALLCKKHHIFLATSGIRDGQMAFLRRRYHVFKIAESLELIANPKAIRRPSFLKTFDDGYRDNHSVALPILRSHGIQVVFFLATSFVGTSRIPWWDQIAFMCRRTERRTIAIEYPEPKVFVLDGAPLHRRLAHSQS